MVVRSAYYLNGVKLFHSRISAGPVGESPVRIRFEDKKVGVNFSPWIGVTGAFAPFKDKNYKAFELEEDQLMILPDLTLTARVKVGLGETGDFFVGAGLGDGLQRVYIAPVGQAEVGYDRFGVRETAVI